MKINIGIIGSSSFIGQQLIKMLTNKNYKIYPKFVFGNEIYQKSEITKNFILLVKIDVNQF